ncbi:MAG: hypothetical protein ACK52H_13600 [Burkholderiales bacterium]
MTTPQATTAALEKLFTNWANASFEKSIECFNEHGFYQHVMAKLDAGADLSQDLPELKNVKNNVAKATVKKLAKQAAEGVDAAWALPSSVAKLFRTTIRSSNNDQSLLPCFDAEYKAETAKGVVKIAVKTWRRNVTVAVDGQTAALDLMHGQVVIAGMRQ